jgi:hypothetical protein
MTATTLMIRAYIMTANMNCMECMNQIWILCDNESTIDVVKNKDIIVDIRKTSNPVELSGIGGNTIKIDPEGDLPGYGTVYYNPNVAANILLFHNLTKKFKSVTYNNTEQDAFVGQRNNGTAIIFKLSKEGLYYYDFQDSIDQQQQRNMSMVVTTVEEAKMKFSKREIEAAETARKLYMILGRPSKKTFEEVIKKGKLLNNPITIQDYRNALLIYGEKT